MSTGGRVRRTHPHGRRIVKRHRQAHYSAYLSPGAREILGSRRDENDDRKIVQDTTLTIVTKTAIIEEDVVVVEDYVAVEEDEIAVFDELTVDDPMVTGRY